ncbi:MAG TPA: CHAT domain-containing protein [Planctomycetota bacterium]|nr:CHAT domain-containing protein [Planctomycetota bacterium]
MAVANRAGFDQLYALAGEVMARCAQPGAEGLAAVEFALDTYLPWCSLDEPRPRAASICAFLAKQHAERILVGGGDPERALVMLERVWPYRDQAGYRACELALWFADACRLAARYADAERALDCCAGVIAGAASQSWQPRELAMLPVHDLQLECRRAALELSLGNPDGMLPHLRRAARILQAPRPVAPAKMHDYFEEVWRDAAALLRREKIDCYMGTEDFAAAVSLADEGVKAASLAEDRAGESLMRFYLAMARSWCPDTTESLLAELEDYATNGHPAQRHLALTRLVALRAQQGEIEAANDCLRRLLATAAGEPDPHLVTMQTELLLLQDDKHAMPRERLQQQEAEQRRAFERMLHGWSITPARDGGVGFLHFLSRRETIGQLIAITLRAAAGPDGEPSEQAVAEALQSVMAAQTHGALSRRLAVQVPSIPELQALLRPDQGILVFLPAHTRTHVFSVGAKRIAYHGLPQGALRLRTDIQRFVGQMQDATDQLEPSPKDSAQMASGLLETGRTLTETLFPAPLREQLGEWHHLTIIGSELLHGRIRGSAEAGFLNYLPIECLPWRESELFGQHFAIDHNVSLPVWAHLADRSTDFSRQSSLRVFGVLHAAGNRAAAASGTADLLQGADMDAIGEPFPNRSPYLDANCTMASVVRSVASREGQPPSIAVFLAHGGYDASNERGSYLQLYDGRLDCDTVQRLGTGDAPFADFVVIAACRAAKAPTRAGDSLANLGGAFLLAGARAVVQSRFDLPLHRTQELLADLLRRLSAGSTIAEAMRAARATDDARDPLDAFRTGVLQVHGFGQSPRRQ